ncbi:MAG: geranylgeranyl reductase [Deltaproteobacteria bacterium]|nr:MAG: geranylgeranyl reductase [Deltaproteobacteria bacterium]
MTVNYDIIIVGAGPGGASAARELSSYGLKVLVLEKTPLPRAKPCAGGLVFRGLDHVPRSVYQAIERYCYETRVNILSCNLSLITKKPEPILAMAMRENFDLALIKAAKSTGARVLTSCKVIDLDFHPKHTKVITTNGGFTCRFVIGADGALSITARRAGFGGPQDLVPALGCELYLDRAQFQRFNRAARFDIGFVPQGYGWVFPKEKHLSVGVGRLRKGPIDLKRLFDDYLRFLGIDRIQGMKKKVSVIPLRPRTSTFVKNRVLLVGDAAGLADPLMAEGISNAILSGQLAARAIRFGNFVEEKVKQCYETLLDRKILNDLNWARKAARCIYDHPRVGALFFRIYGERMREGMMEVMSGKRSYRQILVNPLTYLRPFRLGGAFTHRSLVDKEEGFGYLLSSC